MNRILTILAAFLLLAGVTGLLASEALAQANEDCLMCHSKGGGAPAVDLSPLRGSAHRKVQCVGCHSAASELPHPDTLPAVRCASCHGTEANEYLTHRHGQKVGAGRPQAQACGDCHGAPHAVLRVSDPNSPAHRSRVPTLCASCHDNSRTMGRAVIEQRQPVRSYLESIHGRDFAQGMENAPVCIDCHGAHTMLPASDQNSMIARARIPSTCGRCHVEIAAALAKSVHGVAFKSGIREAPVCTDCHGEHSIRSPKEPASPVYPSSITKTCGACHQAERLVSKLRLPSDRVSTYEESYHGLAGRYGSITVANCASCHGYHDILASSDPASSVNKANLPRTCGKCHVGAGEKLARGFVHSNPVNSKNRLIHWVTVAYILLIVLTISGMFAHNLLDYVKKMKESLKAAREQGMTTRLDFSERVQHVLLAIVFVVLAYTGFAIRYPEAVWAWPLRQMENPERVRSLIHRGAAAVFLGLCAYHVWFLFGTPRGRRQFRELVPRGRDFADLASFARYNLGMGAERPKFGHFNYVEKSEYWALVWGTGVMTLTGLLLVFENVTLKYFPLWVSELATTIHFYEAVLATLAILVWHFYWNIVDPYSYPMNWVWITGRATQKQLHERETKDERSPH